MGKVSKYGVISGSYFPVIGLNREIYGVISGPYFPVFGPEVTPHLDTFHAVSITFFCNVMKSRIQFEPCRIK